MRWIDRIRARLRSLLRRGRVEQELETELQFHFEQHIEENIATGMSVANARAAALRSLGSVAYVKEACRESLGVRLVDELTHDLRYTVRTLIKSPLFTLVAVLTLALGIGANTAIFSVIRAVLLKPLPYPDADRLVLVGETRPDTPGYSGAISALNFLDWTQQNTVFERMAGVTGGDVTLSGGTAEPVYAAGRAVSASYFDVFGMRAALGRTFAPDEDQQPKAHVVVLSHRLWASQFGSDPAVVGKSVRLDGEPYTVIGVMPAGAGVDILDPELWTPRDLARQGGAITVGGHTSRDVHDLNRVVAKLKPGVTLTEARAQMNAIGDRLAAAYPESNKGWGVLVEPWPRPVFQDFERSLYMLLAAVGMVLLIGCVNIANLALARSSARAHDVAIRAALGAGRGRLVRQFLTENLIIAVCGGLFGFVVGYAALAAIRAAIPSTGMFKVVPAETTMTMDVSVCLFSLTLSVLSGLAFGLGPALGATRPALTGFIKEHGGVGVSGGRSARRLRQSLVVAEVALAFVLLTTAGLLIQSFFAMQQRISTGFESTNVLTARLPIPSGRFRDPGALNAYFDQMADRIQSLPGIRDVAFAEGLPTQGTPFGRSFQIADQPPVERARRPICWFKTVSPSYFRALDLRILKGRPLTDHDRDGAPFVVVINETFARMYFTGVDPIGQRLLMKAASTHRPIVLNDVAWEVVGVVADEGLSWNGKPEAFVYGTREQNPSDYLALVVRGTLDPARLQESIRKAVSGFDRDQALANVQSLDELKADYMMSDRLRSVLLSVFAVIAVALAALGLYGVLSYAVVQRTREIGIRAALGASRGSLVALVVRQGMVMTCCGLTLGLGGVIITSRLLTTFLFGVGPSNPTTIAAVGGTLAAVALMASYIPARRAAKVDPLVALRCE